MSVKKSSSSGASSNASYNAGGDGSSRSLHYSGEYLRKLEKSKLSRKQPECMAKLRQENLLRESWRNDSKFLVVLLLFLKHIVLNNGFKLCSLAYFECCLLKVLTFTIIIMFRVHFYNRRGARAGRA